MLRPNSLNRYYFPYDHVNQTPEEKNLEISQKIKRNKIQRIVDNLSEYLIFIFNENKLSVKEIFQIRYLAGYGLTCVIISMIYLVLRIIFQNGV